MKFISRTSAALSLTLVLLGGCASMSAGPVKVADGVLVGPNGEVKLTDLKWVSATSGWGEARIGKNAGGAEMKVAGSTVNGIGVHANSTIVYDLSGKGFTRFKAKGGIDNGGSEQNGGSSVQFLVITP